jgi:hypothetical protein
MLPLHPSPPRYSINTEVSTLHTHNIYYKGGQHHYTGGENNVQARGKVSIKVKERNITLVIRNQNNKKIWGFTYCRRNHNNGLTYRKQQAATI